ncbi:MAG: glycoside hydrolase family 125 protein [Chloroflexi bacterium]|nr:glycoside hydrolase family 125 protein [Chloroflexota bacterium]
MTAADAAHVLDPSRRVKPLDFGGDGITGSVDRDGRLIALNTYHNHYGYITLTTAPPFREDARYDPAAVRAYRASLAALDGMGPVFAPPVIKRQAALLEGAIPHVALRFEGGGSAAVTTWAQGGGAVQLWRFEGVQPRWQGCISLQRCAYTQLTEGGPLPVPPLQTRVMFADGVLTVSHPALGCVAALAGFPPGPAWEQTAEGRVEVDLDCGTGTLVLACGFGPDAFTAREYASALTHQQDIGYSLGKLRQMWRSRLVAAPRHPLVRRGLVYGLALTVPVGMADCILTDHMLLPLSWNRDAYYVARMLLSWRPEFAELVQRHLLWMFETAERADGAWGRCYLANGRIKDRAFQLDQQLFPLLELAEYTLETGNWETWQRLQPQLAALREMLLSRKAPDDWLFPTDETPADDPLAFPYHFSSHLLMWRTFGRLAAVERGAGWDDLAGQIRTAIQRHFVAPRDGTALYAYATDGHGRYHFYHDANDVPLALAPAWGFVGADDPVWRATVDFAFSEQNEGGYYGAHRLGSVHTRAPWPLGDVQDVIIARALGDSDRERVAWVRLEAAAQWDGALPEAYHPETGEVASRHWFAWPNALLAGVALGAFG